MEYANKIRGVRAYLGFKQKDLADALGITTQTLSSYESGKTVPKVDVWDKIMAMAPEMFK